MGSAVSVNKCYKQCNDLFCPEETNSIEQMIQSNPQINQENENPIFKNDNSNYDKKITNLIKADNEQNNINNSLIKIEENKENKENHENDNKKINSPSFKDNNIHKDIVLNNNPDENFTFKYVKQANLKNSNTVKEAIEIKNNIKPNLKPITQSIIKPKVKNKKMKLKDKNGNVISVFDFDHTNIEKNKHKTKVQFNIKKESEIKTNFEEEKNHKNVEDKNNSMNNSEISTKNKKISLKRNDNSLSDSVVVKSNSSNLLSFILETMIVNQESSRTVILKSNKIQNSFPKFSLKNRLDNDFIKGNFLLKKMKFKYKGDKDLDGKKFGFGIIIYEDSSKLIGNFFDSKLNGIVKFYNCGLDNSTYIGEYKNNIPLGYGIYSRQGLKLEGMNWNKNYINNIGIAVWDNNELYEGEFKDNLKEGIGTYRWEDGSIYMGSFKNNQLNGYGYINFANGNSYEGEFIEGYLSGWGRFNWEDGKCYVGNYKKNKKNGFGIFISSFQPLIALIGFWEKGKQNGLFVNLVNGYSKYYFYQNSKKYMEIEFLGDICRYLQSSQMKYKNFFKKSYRQLEYFIKTSTST